MENIERFLGIDSDSEYNHNHYDDEYDDIYDLAKDFGYGRSSGHGYLDDKGDGSNNKPGGDHNGYGGYNSNGDGYGGGAGSGSIYGRNGVVFGGSYDYRDIKSINGKTVYVIDSIPTIIEKIKGNLARGFILNADMTLTPCYIAKYGNRFTHGETLDDIRKELPKKLFGGMSEKERINKFLAEFNTTDKYPAKMLYEWHNTLTFSCEAGRQSFVKNHNIDLDNDSFTVREFCELCKNDYGGNIIKKILRKIK